MEKEFIPYEQLLALKELGYDEPCFGIYYGQSDLKLFQDCSWEERTNSKFLSFFEDRDEFCTAISYQQAFRWFREKYGLDYSINPFYYPETTKIRFRWDYFKFIYHEVPNRRKFESFGGGEATREEAELECLKKLIEIVKTKK